jgi:hypothetical protein
MTMRNMRAVSVVGLVLLSACASAEPPQPQPPRVVRIPAGWLTKGAHAPSKTSPKTSTSAASAPAETDTEPDDAEPDPATDTPEAPAAPTTIDLQSDAPRTKPLPLRDTLFNPLPGGQLAGYFGDTGLDIASAPRPVHAIAAGTLDYSEEGHTRWIGPKDTKFSVRLELDTPIPWKGHLVTHVYYTHLSAVEVIQPEGATPRHHVEGGQRLGTSGIANGLPHLHLGLLLDRNVDQAEWGTFLLEGEIRVVLGGWKNGQFFPKT